MRRTQRPSSSAEAPSAAPGDGLPALGASAPREPLGWATMEVVWLLAIFFLFAGSPPPDVGEAHYLAKAKHYWDPSWAAGDLFLESGDAHWVFYWTFGWVTKFVSLDAAAWIGRFISWLLLAWSWRRLSWAIAPVRLASLLSAGLMLLFARHFHLAGEWIVGGVEAKSFAYGFVFLALESLICGRWRSATLLAGVATAFHVLVGGWTLVGLAAVWLASPAARLPLRLLWPALLGGALLALPGIIPALLLTRGVDAGTVSAANVIYVFERLPHHLVIHRFEYFFMARSALLLALWGLLAWSTGRSPELRRLNWFVAAALGLALIGIVIDQSLLWHRELAAKLLKYYWYRLADAMLPVSVALLLTRLIVVRYQQDRLGAWLLTVAILSAGWNLGDVCLRRSRERLPGSFLQPKPVAYRQAFSGLQPAMPADRLFEFWVAANEWIRENTPKNARFLTPRRQQTFKWYAHRPEVASWKDVPQDAKALVEWREAIQEIYPPGRGRFDLAAHTEAELLRLAEKYDADYILLDRLRAGRPLSWERVYPAFDEENPAFEVYRVPRALPKPTTNPANSPAD